MSSWNRRLLGLVLGGVLLVSVGCSSTEDGPAAPSGGAPQASIVSTVTSTVTSTVSTALSTVDLLTCKSLPYAASTATLGADGGTIRIGKSALVVPRGALAKPTTIKAEQMPGSVNSIRFSPEGLRFAKPAQLTMSYENCLLVLPTKHIVYTTEGLKVLELLKSLDLRLQRTVSAPLDHFSRYAIAY
jgi:hypothetical protein